MHAWHKIGQSEVSGDSERDFEFIFRKQEFSGGKLKSLHITRNKDFTVAPV